LDIATDRLIETARQRLQEFGIDLEVESRRSQDRPPHVDAVATLSRADAKARYAIQLVEPMTLSALARETAARHPHPLLVIGDRVTPRSAASFRDAGIQFVDTLGNAFIEFDGVLVEVRGRARDLRSDDRVTRPRRPANMFSFRRSQVILALLAWPELASATIREIAHAAIVSVGQAHDAMTQLQQSGFLNPVSRRLDRTDELLDYWTAAYPTGLGRQLEIARYYGDPSRPVSRPDVKQPVYLSGESAEGAGIARPVTLTVYLDVLDPKLPVINRWSSSRERIPNVFVRRKFWISPHPHEEKPSNKGRNAPWPLVYADLLAAGDPRLGEMARVWRAHHARSDEV
jgi:hypothetical protein